MQDRTLFVQKVNPPWVYEVNYEERTKPSIKRVFAVSDDEGSYVSFGLVDANLDYVLVHLFSTKQLKPVFRVYKRSKFFFSIGHTEIDYTEFTDPGVYAHFTNV